MRVLDTTGALYTSAQFEVSDDWTTRGRFSPEVEVRAGQYIIELTDSGERCWFVIENDAGTYRLQRIVGRAL